MAPNEKRSFNKNTISQEEKAEQIETKQSVVVDDKM